MRYLTALLHRWGALPPAQYHPESSLRQIATLHWKSRQSCYKNYRKPTSCNIIYSTSEVLLVRSFISRSILHWERSILAEEKVSSTYSLKLLPQHHRAKWRCAAPWPSKSPPQPTSWQNHISSPLKGTSEPGCERKFPSQSRGSLFQLRSSSQRRGSGRAACRGEGARV